MKTVEMIVLAVVVLVLVIYFVIKAIKNGWIKKLYETVIAAIKEAEATELKGEDKKKFVLKKLEEKCHELGIPYYVISKLLSKLIDTIISHYNVLSK